MKSKDKLQQLTNGSLTATLTNGCLIKACNIEITFACTNKKQIFKHTIYKIIENTKFQGLHIGIY